MIMQALREHEARFQGPSRQDPGQRKTDSRRLAAYSRARPEIRAACGAAVPTSSSTGSADVRGPV